MADDTMRRRREIVARAFAARRDKLGLTQEKLAQRADVALRTVLNFETQGRWPNARTRERLEHAVGWPPGEIKRLAEPPEPEPDPELVELASRLTDVEAEALIGLLRRRRERAEGTDQPGRSAACG